MFGEKEWLETKYGKKYQRKIWRKLHIGIDEQVFIVAREMTTHLTDDRSCVSSLITQANAENAHDLLADGEYDSHAVYHCLKEKNY